MPKFTRRATIAMSAAAAMLFTPATLAQNAAATSNDLPPEGAIEARRGLMRSVNAILQEIRTVTPADLDEVGVYDLQQRYLAIGGMLRALPYLFPAGSDLPEPAIAAGGNPSIATPAVWTDFPTLVALAEAAADIAFAASIAPQEELAEQVRTLRSGCTACHSIFMEYRVADFGAPVEGPVPLP